MLNRMIAIELLKQLRAFVPYPMTVVNVKGLVLTGTNEPQPGSFHQAAWDAIKKNPIELHFTVKGDYYGIPEIAMVPLILKQNVEGVLIIDGSREEVTPYVDTAQKVAGIILDYESRNIKSQRYRSQKDLFINELLYEENVSELELIKNAERLNFQAYALRVPVILVFDETADSEKMLNLLLEKSNCSLQDIYLRTRNNKIFFFKKLEGNPRILSEYKQIVLDFLQPFVEAMDCQGTDFRVIVGTFQKKLKYYRSSINHCLWLENACTGREQVLFFYDYTARYLQSIVPESEYHKLFNVFPSLFGQEFVENFVRIIPVLSDCNYNLNEASKELFVHKNTLMLHFKKIRETIGINPLQLSQARSIMDTLGYYLRVTVHTPAKKRQCCEQ